MQPIQEGEKEVKDLEDWAAVQKVYKQTKSKRATAKILSISRNTVKRLLDMTEPPVYRRTEYSSKIDEYKELIIEWRCDPYNYNGTPQHIIPNMLIPILSFQAQMILRLI